MHIRLRTLKNGPVIRNRLRLPHPVKTDLRICVIAAPDSKAAAEARAAGAVLVGEDDIFASIKEGVIDFDRCLCHIDSLQKLTKAGLGRQLGPKGLMPSTKTGTVITNVGASVRNMVGASEFRERLGVIRMAVGQLGYNPEQLSTNIKAFMDLVKRDIGQLGDKIGKEIHEVVSCAFVEVVIWEWNANVWTGPELDECAGLHAEWRFQRRELDSAEGTFGTPIGFRV
jgi:large subunit ribosomal protein L1